MSWLSKATGIHLGGKQLGSLGGALLGSLIPIPGVGTALGASLGAGLGRTVGGLTSGESLGQAALHGVGTGAGTYGVSQVVPHIPGLNKIPGFGGGGSDGTPAAGAPPPGDYSNAFQNDVVNPMASRLGGGGGGSVMSNLGNFAGKHGDALIQAGGGAFSSINANQQAAAQRAFLQQQFDFQKQQALRQNQLEDQERQRKMQLGQQWLQGMSNSNPNNPQLQQILQSMGY